MIRLSDRQLLLELHRCPQGIAHQETFRGREGTLRRLLKKKMVSRFLHREPGITKQHVWITPRGHRALEAAWCCYSAAHSRLVAKPRDRCTKPLKQFGTTWVWTLEVPDGEPLCVLRRDHAGECKTDPKRLAQEASHKAQKRGPKQ